jgi:hypothetical protein
VLGYSIWWPVISIVTLCDFCCGILSGRRISASVVGTGLSRSRAPCTPHHSHYADSTNTRQQMYAVQSARASGPSFLQSSSEATRGGRGGRMRFCCMPLESAALQEVEAWPPKSDICPRRSALP